MKMNSTKKLVENIYKAFTHGDVKYNELSQSTIDICTDEVSWSYYGFPGLPFIGDFRGKDGVKQFFESLRLTINPLDYKCHELIVDGERAVVLGSAKVLVKPTGKEFEHNWCHVYNLKNERIVDFRGFTSNPHGLALAFNVQFSA